MINIIIYDVYHSFWDVPFGFSGRTLKLANQAAITTTATSVLLY